jgi:hypothetical protein
MVGMYKYNSMRNNDQILLKELYSEMALSNLQKIGKWDDKKNRHGYDKASVGILSSPSGLKKLENTFNKIGGWDFNLYFVKLPNAWRQSELGIIDVNKLPQLIKVEAGVDFPMPKDNEITVIFTNNSAAEKLPLTPWTIAHRIGHAFAATSRKQNDNSEKYYDIKISNTLQKLLKCYDLTSDRDPRYSSAYYMRDLYQKIGKFRSARMGKLTRPAEFYHEAFAYWLLHDGELDFNDLPQTLIDSNKQAWGTPTGMTHRLQDAETANDLLYQLKYEIEEKFHYMIGKHIGTTSIM